jgi:hypothetical protein
MIAFPYPKRMNAILDVNQGAALLLASDEVATRLGVPARAVGVSLGGRRRDRSSGSCRIGATTTRCRRRSARRAAFSRRPACARATSAISISTAAFRSRRG